MKPIVNRLSLVLVAVCIALGTLSCMSAQPKPKPETVTFSIIETSDLHGAWFPYDFKTGQAKPTSLANVVTMLKSERSKGEVLFVDNGDNLQGQPIVYYYNFKETTGVHPFSSVMNALNYDAIGFGNHDVETGHAVYDKIQSELKTKFICTNIVNTSDGKPYFKPYSIVEKGGIRIAILSLIEPAYVKNFPEILYSGTRVEGMVPTAQKWIPIIQAQEKPDMIIGLFHSGVDYTYGGYTKEDPLNENASQLVAEQVEGFDLVLVGHDHQGWDGKGWDPVTKTKVDVKSPSGRIVPIYGALDDARKIPLIKVMGTLDPSSGHYNFDIQGQLVDMTSISPDADFVSQFAGVADKAKTWLNQKIGTMVGSINTRDSMYGDSAFVDLIHNLQLELSKDPQNGLKPAQISFAAPLSANAVLPSRADGSITVADMFTLYRYENWLYTMDLTGAQIDGFLEDSYGNWFAQMDDEGDNLIAFARKPDGSIDMDPRSNLPRTKTASYNYDSAQGIDYVVDVSKPVGQRVTITRLSNGQVFDPTRTYTVAINSYRAMGGGGILSRGAGIPTADLLAMKYVTSATTMDLRIYLTQWIERNNSKPLEPKADNNWKVVPANLAGAGAARDKALMYPSN